MTRSIHWFFIIAVVAMLGTAACTKSGPRTHASEGNSQSQPGQVARWRQALNEENLRLSDREVVFIHEALIRHAGEYEQRGLETFLEWELRATVRGTPQTFVLNVVPTTGRVNAEWELVVDRSSGDIKDGAQWSIVEPPGSEERAD